MEWEVVWLLLVGLAGIGRLVQAKRRVCKLADRRQYRRRSATAQVAATAAPRRHARRKPEWVRVTVIRMAAESPGAGVRTLSNAFNFRHADLGVSVGRTFVHGTLMQHRLQAIRSERTRNVPPPPCPIRAVWALDITEHRLDPAVPQPVVGLLDHGSRALLSLEALRDKSSITLLRIVLTAIEHYGRPAALRTDNEAVFTSRLFGFGLRWLGIRHQRTALHSPWQSGRIERVFGTIKPLLRLFAPADLTGLRYALRMLGQTYNQLRPHSALGGQTPAQVWRREDRLASGARRRRR